MHQQDRILLGGDLVGFDAQSKGAVGIPTNGGTGRQSTRGKRANPVHTSRLPAGDESVGGYDHIKTLHENRISVHGSVSVGDEEDPRCFTSDSKGG